MLENQGFEFLMEVENKIYMNLSYVFKLRIVQTREFVLKTLLHKLPMKKEKLKEFGKLP